MIAHTLDHHLPHPYLAYFEDYNNQHILRTVIWNSLYMQKALTVQLISILDFVNLYLQICKTVCGHKTVNVSSPFYVLPVTTKYKAL